MRNKILQNTLRLELRKSFRNKAFLFSAAVGLVFVVMSAYSRISLEFSELGFRAFVDRQIEDLGYAKYPIVPMSTLYSEWIGGEVFSVAVSLFYTLLPLLAILPYGSSFSEEVHSGYIKVLISRCGRRTYFLSKFAAAFVSGGTVIVLPQTVSLLICAAVFPAVKPNVIYHQYLALHHWSMLGRLGNEHPLLFVLAFLGIDFVFAGLFACLAISAAFFFRSRLAVIAVPFLALLGSDMSRSLLGHISYVEISPLKFLHAIPFENYTKTPVVLLWLLLLNLLTVPVILGKGCRYEVL